MFETFSAIHLIWTRGFNQILVAPLKKENVRVVCLSFDEQFDRG